MAVRRTIQLGDPRLKKPNLKIVDFESKKVLQIVQDLRDTMYKNGLVGMAAPQIGENFQIFVTEPRETESRPASESDEFRVYINPEIVGNSSDDIVIYEACGSVMHSTLFGPVSRPRVITIEAYTLEGQKFRFMADGLLGRVIQHEQDHMVGVEFTEKVTDYKLLTSRRHFLKQIRNRPDQIQAQKTTLKDFSLI